MHQHTHIGVYALAQKEDHLLLIKKARGPYTGKWDLPGGGFEFGETPLETLHRECMEETGQKVAKATLLDVLSHTVRYQKEDGGQETVHHIGVLYRIEIASDVNQLKEEGDGEDSLGAQWIPIATINEEKCSPFVNRSLDYLSQNSSIL